MGAPTAVTARTWVRRHRRGLVGTAWGVALAALMLGPALAPGFVLSYDMVFTPAQDLLPGSVGLGSGLPRAVPQDAVVALATTVIPAWLLQKAILVAIPVLTVTGMVRLLRGAPLLVALVAGTLAVWNPFVAERLVIGHWGLLLAVALAPWALALALDARRGVPGAAVRLVLVIAAGALTPSGAVLLLVLAVPPALLPGSALGRRGRVAVAVLAVAMSLPWTVPALLHPLAGSADPLGAEVFALRAEGPWGPVLTALGTGGIWNAEVVLASRGWWLAPVGALLIVALAAAGFGPLRDLLGRAVSTWWAVVAGMGLIAAVSSAVLPRVWSTLVTATPGLGLFRDAQKLLAPLALLLAVAAALGIGRLAGRAADRATANTIVVAGLLIPLALLPDLAFGASGRLVAVHYPSEVTEAREVIRADGRPGDVVVLPWTAFRRYEFNGGRTVLDPAPRWLPRTSVVDDALVVARGSDLLVVSGDDPRAARVRDLIESAPTSDSLAEGLASLGIAWVLVQTDQPGAVPAAVQEFPSAWVGPTLELREVPAPVVVTQIPAWTAVIVVGVDLAVVAVVMALVVIVIRRGYRRQRDDAGERLVR